MMYMYIYIKKEDLFILASQIQLMYKGIYA